MHELQINLISRCLFNLGKGLLEEIFEYGKITPFEPGEFVLKQGQQVRYLPIVLEGLVKVFSQEDSYQFLLYYIYPGSTCIFSFAHLFGQNGIPFSGIIEEKSTILLIPIAKAQEWAMKYPAFNTMIIKEYEKHYNDLLETTKQVICYDLEDRILKYLNTKASILKNNTINISHKDIAEDLATSREVISRILKKLEKDNRIQQIGRKIKVL